MTAVTRLQANANPSDSRFRLNRRLLVLLFVALSLGPIGVSAHSDLDGAEGHTLEVAISFPDAGLAAKEQLCLGLYPSSTNDFSRPPLQSRCLDSGEQAATFEGIDHGDFIVAVPSTGTEIASDRYEGQLIETSIPDEPTISAFGIDVEVLLTPEASGTTGRVQVNVYGCPPGTDGGGDAEFWATECQAVAGGIPLSLSGVGTIEQTAIEAVTGENGVSSGRAYFTNLPAGAYQLGGELPGNLTVPTVFIQSSLEGSMHPIDQGETLDLRPTETVAVDVYLVALDGQDTATVQSATTVNPTTILGFGDQQITGGLTPAQEASRQNQDIQE